jgi:nucleoside phosphorylase
VEYRAVRAQLTGLREEVHPQGTIYERGTFAAGGATWDVGLVQIGAGNAGAALEAERAIAYFAPSVVLFVGVAGGLKDVAIGDVVAATRIYGYESGKAADEGFRPRPDVGESSYRLVQRARAEATRDEWLERIRGPQPAQAPQAFVGPIAAGEKVMANLESAIVHLLRATYGDALAVEMEGRGFLQATHANERVQALVVRGISDLVAGKSAADAQGAQDLAARHAAAFAFQVLTKLAAAPTGASAPAAGLVQSDPDAGAGSPAPPRETAPVLEPPRTQVFVSYSHVDRRWLERLQVHMRPLVRQGTIDLWDDTQIAPGTDWRAAITAALARARVAVLLVTPDFLASQFIATEELPRLLDAAEQEGLTILWIAVRPSAYKGSPIARYQAASDPDRPLSGLNTSRRDQTLVQISEVIARAATAPATSTPAQNRENRA